MSRWVRVTIFVIGLAAAAALVVVGFYAPRAAAAGWLIAYVTIGAVPLGAVALLLIHSLTAGRWGDVARPSLAAAASVVPLLVAFFAGVLLTVRAIYPWVAEPSAAGPGVADLYLNPAFFGLRGLVFLVVLAGFAVPAATRPLGQLAAGFGLVWYCVGMDLLAVDWLLSLDARYTSSAFGSQIIVAQLIAGLAFAITSIDAPANDAAWNDLGSLLLTTILGESYLILMTFIVHWYGDLPDQAAWYLEHVEHGWVALAIAGVLIGAVGPLTALLFSRVRAAKTPLRVVAVASLIGVAIEMTWLVAPATGGWSALTGLLAITAAGGVAAVSGDVIGALIRKDHRHGV